MEILSEFGQVCFLTLLGLTAIVGLLAVVSPSTFALVASLGSRKIQTGGWSLSGHWFDIDSYAIEHARAFGLLVLGAEGFIWSVAFYGPEAYSKSILLLIVALSLLMGIVSLGHIMRQKHEIEAKLAESRTDSLTGLANRRAFDESLSRRIAQRQRQGTPFCLQIIDIDHFKSFNDGYGHLFGDAVIKEIAEVLSATARQMDIVARLGGDEFAVMLPGCSLEEASAAAERFRTAINKKPFCYEGREHCLTVSIGLAEAEDDDDVRSLIRRADSALYAAKEAGRDCSFRQGGPEPAVPALAETSPPA